MQSFIDKNYMNIFTQNIITTENGVIKLVEDYKDLLNKTPYYIDCSTVSGQLKAYQKCDVVRSLIGKSSQFIANLKIWALNNDGSENTTRLAKQEIDKLNQPNPEEDRIIFFQKLDQQVKLHGKALVRKVKDNTDEYYYVIPQEFISTIDYENDVTLNFERKVKQYGINDGVRSYYLKANEVFTFYDVVLSRDSYTMYGGSRLESLSEVISTYVVIWEVLTEMYGDRGALNIISMGINNPQMMALQQTAKEKNSFMTFLKEKFGTRRGQNKNLVTALDAKVSPISAKMADMMFENTLKDCKKAICNGFDYPPELIGVDSARFKTMPEAIKIAYTQGAVTSFERVLSQWMTMRKVSPSNFKICADYSHLEHYQEAQLQKAVAFQQMVNAIAAISDKTIGGKEIITWDEARIQLDLK